MSRQSVEISLQEGFQSMQIRAEVEETLQSLLTDVELTAHLNQQLSTRMEQKQLQQRLLQQNEQIRELQAMVSQQSTQRRSLADALVPELYKMGQQWKALEAWKSKNEYKVEQYDEVMAQLAQAYEDLQEMRNIVAATEASVQSAPTPQLHASSTAEPTEETENKEQHPKEPETKDNDETADKKEAPKEDAAVVRAEPQKEETTEEKLPAAETPPEPKPEETKTDEDLPLLEENDTDDAVALIEEEGGEEPSLDKLDMEILMTVFGFLDAIDILNTAQINISMYSRVDSLFGLGASHAQEQTQTPAATTTTADERSTSGTASVGTTQSEPSKSTGTIVSLPPKKTSRSEIIAEADSSRLNKGGIFGLGLLPRAAAAASGRAGSSTSGSKKSASASEAPLSAAMANSMAEKLNDAELTAIISMTEKLRKLQQEVGTLKNAKEELEGKLEGTEAVKQFLINKVREVEQNLNKSQEDATKVTQQIASDQEVIAFLDNQVQGLEASTRQLQQERDSAVNELKQVKKQSADRNTVLSDMLQYEREKLREHEREWKNTKKVLIREVKNCRAQILALQAERDGFREQNLVLQKAVLVLPQSESREER